MIFMKRIARFLLIVAAMQAYYFTYTFFFSPILENLLFDGIREVSVSAMISFALIVQALAAVIFIILYIKWYIAVPQHKREFLKRLETVEYSMRADIINYIEENNGNIDVLIYGVYSAVLPVSVLLFGGSSPVLFLYFPQLIFYSFVFTDILIMNLVAGYTLSMIYFLLAYISGVAIVHKIWYKHRLRR